MQWQSRPFFSAVEMSAMSEMTSRQLAAFWSGAEAYGSRVAQRYNQGVCWSFSEFQNLPASLLQALGWTPQTRTSLPIYYGEDVNAYPSNLWEYKGSETLEEKVPYKVRFPAINQSVIPVYKGDSFGQHMTYGRLHIFTLSGREISPSGVLGDSSFMPWLAAQKSKSVSDIMRQLLDIHRDLGRPLDWLNDLMSL